MNVFLIFLFCLISKWNANVWFDVFFWKMVVDVHDSVCKNVGYVVDNVDGIRVIWDDWIGDFNLTNNYRLEREELIGSQLALW